MAFYGQIAQCDERAGPLDSDAHPAVRWRSAVKTKTNQATTPSCGQKKTAEAQRASIRVAGSIDLAHLGLNQIAYVRRSMVENQPIWKIHSASGDQLGAAVSFQQAWGAVVQNEMVPMYVH
jgi:hypothetical protein